MELCSMGIRVDAEVLRNLPHAGGAPAEFVLSPTATRGQMPLSIGGGIGQLRLCMFYLRKAHIGEVQVSSWPPEIAAAWREHGTPLL